MCHTCANDHNVEFIIRHVGELSTMETIDPRYDLFLNLQRYIKGAG